MNNLTQSIKVLALALVLSVGISYVSAWTVPTDTPPSSNASAPINVSSTAQVKAGSLGVSGLFRGYGNVIVDGNMGVGTVAPTQKLDVVGGIKSSTIVQGMNLQVDGTAVIGAACSPNGLVAQDGTGELLSCKNGTWQAVGGSGGGGLGVGQTWQNMNAVRSWNTVYQNTTGKPIEVSGALYACASGSVGGPNGFVGPTASGPWVWAAGDSSGGAGGVGGGLSFIVPDGMYYWLNSGGSICGRNWAELR